MIGASGEADVVIVGGGISGCGCALRLKDLGLTPLVLEREARVGGRMTTDRISRFTIDRGVTLLGSRFQAMRSIVKRFNLDPDVISGRGLFCIDNEGARTMYRAGRFDQVLLSRSLPWKAKAVFLRFLFDIVINYPRLYHGESFKALHLDNESAADYFRRLGGPELFDRVFAPGVKGPLGGSAYKCSKLMFTQMIANIIATSTWVLNSGMDQIPEALSQEFSVLKEREATRIEFASHGVMVTTAGSHGSERFKARQVVVALPGHLIPNLFVDLPTWAIQPLKETKYARMANVHVALSKIPEITCLGYTYGQALDGIELEFEHMRAPKLCPKNQAMISAFLWDTSNASPLSLNDSALRDYALKVICRSFPEIAQSVQFSHIVRCDAAIPIFEPGRARAMAELRGQLSSSTLPFDLCGDYLDGGASESALRTGQQAAERVALRMGKGLD